VKKGEEKSGGYIKCKNRQIEKTGDCYAKVNSQVWENLKEEEAVVSQKKKLLLI
jgi:hypothetical protein